MRCKGSQRIVWIQWKVGGNVGGKDGMGKIMGSELKVGVKPKKSEKSTRVGKITRLGDGAGKIIGSQLKVESKKRWKGESFPSITISTWLFASLPNQLYTKSFVCFHIARPPSNPYESFCPSYTSKEICSFSVFKFFLISSDIVTWSFLSTPYPIHQNGAIQLFLNLQLTFDKGDLPIHFQCETQHLIFGNWISVLGYCQYISSAQILKKLSRFSSPSIVVYSLSSKQPIFSASCQLLCLLSNKLRAPLVHENYLAFIAKTFRPKI